METKDLMINDLVRQKYSNLLLKVSNINPPYIQAFDEGGQFGEDTIEPIPLTAEILEKNGFTLKKADMYFPNDGYIWFDSLESNELVEIHIYDKPINGVMVLTKITNDCKAHGGVNKVHSCEIENVHELQHALRLCGLSELADNFKV